MRIITPIFLLLGLALYACCATTEENSYEEDSVGILECMFTDNAGNCIRTRLARDLDRIELEVIGKKSEPSMSAVVEQAGNIIAEVVDGLQEDGAEEIRGRIEEDDAQGNIGENRITVNDNRCVNKQRDNFNFL
ncbi:uncharacterized protein LOC105431256 [Pogonomyrmex barbatus]|uniref:Uncharacterized protein LOC105431256 n=1 Tax=Pogonomyrmex barbatus TaxID=144034 RepID=A0A6I9WUY2_9HYME|nr:uncharacterized protein LOC105431256 [Pogonomyrmex barbatus]